MFSVDAISQAICIPNHGENRFKGMNLDLEEYKPYLKSQYKGAHSHVFPFRYLLERYEPLMKVVMKFFTCEGIFSRLYQYHIRLLMHFTAPKSLNLSSYLYMSLTKLSERVQLKGKVHYPSLFHHSPIKVIALHQLTYKNMAWDTFIEVALKTHITISPSQHQTMSVHPMEVGSSRKHDEISKAPRPEVSKTYQRGRRLAFSPY